VTSPYVATKLSRISAWIDRANAHRHPETNLWSRVSKAAEEGGEAMDALRGFLGENPRKGQCNTMTDVVEELLDTAVAALGAVEHLTGNNGISMAMLAAHVEKMYHRAGLDNSQLCPSCGHLPDTPNHVYGCEGGLLHEQAPARPVEP
jgi:hypothetical protein